MVIPGTHDIYDRSSIYRAYDLKALAGSTADDDLVTVLTPDQPSVHLTACDVVVHGPVFATKTRAPQPAARPRQAATTGDAAAPTTWRIGMVHGSIAIPGKTERDDVVITTEEIAATGLDYLALGHWHSAQQSRAGGVTYAYAGAPEAVALDQDRAGKVLLVELEEIDGRRSVTVQERQVGATRFEKVELDAADVSVAAGAHRHARARRPIRTSSSTPGSSASGRTSSTCTSTRSRPRWPASFLKVRVRDVSLPALTEGALPPPDTIAGAFIRDLEARIAELEAAAGTDADGRGRTAEAAELRDALRLGRLLLAGHEVSL